MRRHHLNLYLQFLHLQRFHSHRLNHFRRHLSHQFLLLLVGLKDHYSHHHHRHLL